MTAAAVALVLGRLLGEAPRTGARPCDRADAPLRGVDSRGDAAARLPRRAASGRLPQPSERRSGRHVAAAERERRLHGSPWLGRPGDRLLRDGGLRAAADERVSVMALVSWVAR